MARDMVRVKIKGAKSLEEAFLEHAKNMSDREAQRFLEDAWVEAAGPIVTHAQSIVRKRSGKTATLIQASPVLARSQEPTPFTRKGFARAYIGLPTRSLGFIIEFGTTLRFWTAARERQRAKREKRAVREVAHKSTGRMPAFPFLRPSWEAGKFPLLERFAKVLWRRIEDDANRIGARQKAGL